MVRRPSEWAEAQRSYRRAYERDPATLPRTRVHWRCVPASAVPLPRGVGFGAILSTAIAAARVVRRTSAGRNLSASPFAAVWSPDAPEGSPPSLIFEVANETTEGEGDGYIVGEMELNGALCVEPDDGAIMWPTFNPRIPAFNAERR